MVAFIMNLNEKEKFGAIQLDETHIFLHQKDTKCIETIQARMDELLEKNNYEIGNTEIRDKLFRIDGNENY